MVKKRVRTKKKSKPSHIIFRRVKPKDNSVEGGGYLHHIALA